MKRISLLALLLLFAFGSATLLTGCKDDDPEVEEGQLTASFSGGADRSFKSEPNQGEETDNTYYTSGGGFNIDTDALPVEIPGFGDGQDVGTVFSIIANNAPEGTSFTITIPVGEDSVLSTGTFTFPGTEVPATVTVDEIGAVIDLVNSGGILFSSPEYSISTLDNGIGGTLTIESVNAPDPTSPEGSTISGSFSVTLSPATAPVLDQASVAAAVPDQAGTILALIGGTPETLAAGVAENWANSWPISETGPTAEVTGEFRSIPFNAAGAGGFGN